MFQTCNSFYNASKYLKLFEFEYNFNVKILFFVSCLIFRNFVRIYLVQRLVSEYIIIPLCVFG